MQVNNSKTTTTVHLKDMYESVANIITDVTEDIHTNNIDNINSEISDIKDKIDALNNITQDAKNLQDIAKKLRFNNLESMNQNALLYKTVLNSNSDIAEITTTDEAARGSYALEVMSLAVSPKYISTSFTSSSEVIVSASPPESGKVSTGIFKINDNSIEISSNETLQSLCGKINDAQNDVQATCVKFTTNDWRILLISETGLLEFKDDTDIVITDNTSILSDVIGPGGGTSIAAQEGEVRYHGISLYRSTNQIDDIFNGVVLNLKKTGLIDFSVVYDSQKLQESVISLIDAYNTLTQSYEAQKERDENFQYLETAKLRNNIFLENLMFKILHEFSNHSSSMLEMGLDFDDESYPMIKIDNIDKFNEAFETEEGIENVQKFFQWYESVSSKNMFILNRGELGDVNQITLKLDPAQAQSSSDRLSTSYSYNASNTLEDVVKVEFTLDYSTQPTSPTGSASITLRSGENVLEAIEIQENADATYSIKFTQEDTLLPNAEFQDSGTADATLSYFFDKYYQVSLADIQGLYSSETSAPCIFTVNKNPTTFTNAVEIDTSIQQLDFTINYSATPIENAVTVSYTDGGIPLSETAIFTAKDVNALQNGGTITFDVSSPLNGLSLDYNGEGSGVETVTYYPNIKETLMLGGTIEFPIGHQLHGFKFLFTGNESENILLEMSQGVADRLYKHLEDALVYNGFNYELDRFNSELSNAKSKITKEDERYEKQKENDIRRLNQLSEAQAKYDSAQTYIDAMNDAMNRNK